MKKLLIVNILLGCVVLGLAASDFWTVLLMSIAIGGCGFYLWLGTLQGKFELRLSTVLAGSIATGYGGGSVMAYILAAMTDRNIFVIQSVSPAYTAFALSLIAAACALLLTLGTFEPPIQITTEGAESLSEKILLLMLAFIGLAFVHGDLDMQGANVGSGGEVSVLGVIASMFNNIALPMAAVGYFRAEGLQKKRFLFWTLFALLALVPITRRRLAYGILVALFMVVRVAGVKTRLSALKKVLLAGVFLAIMSFGTVFFIALRLVSGATLDETQKIKSSIPVTQRAAMAWSVVRYNPGAVWQWLGQSSAGRFFVINYPARLAHGGAMPTPLMGEDLGLALKLVTPRVFFRVFLNEDKTLTDTSDEEGLANEHFGLPFADDANSIITSGIVDFGIAGVMIYPLLLVLIFRFAIAAMQRFLSNSEFLALLSFVLMVFIQVEIGISAYVSELRNLVILIVLWKLLKFISGFRLRARTDFSRLQVP